MRRLLRSGRAWVVVLVTLLAALLILKALLPAEIPGNLELDRMGRIPVQEGGRIKPIDTIARTSLMIVSGRQSYTGAEGRRLQAMEWFAELVLDPQSAAQREVFRIDHPELVSLIGFSNDKRKYFSLTEIVPHFQSLQEQFARIPSESALRNPYEKALVKLQNSLGLYDQVAYIFVPPPFFGNAQRTYGMIIRIHEDVATQEPHTESHQTARNALQLFANQFSQLAAGSHVQAIPPVPGKEASEWHPLGQSLTDTLGTGQFDDIVTAWANLSAAYQEKDAESFNGVLADLEAHYAQRVDHRAGKAPFEHFFNAFSPFMVAMQLYVLIFIVAAFSWMIWPSTLARTAFWLLVAAFAVHTFGMAARVYIQERPPVTNLYSSAIFVSWAAIPLCLYMERRYLNGIPAAAAALMGFVTLIIAHYLSFSGDTMEMMRAVLDSNFWLATHVPTVTLGYSATFLAGLIATVYIIRSSLPGGVDRQTEKVALGMVYGSVCFALFFSYVGTVLGGIWADQSWGRFWGWDPKENGALMIVLWNAVILHARWARISSTVGIMQLAVVGNIITAWSWFGTNMLGVGLHSYGFMDSAFFWLMAFNATQLIVILLGYRCKPPR